MEDALRAYVEAAAKLLRADVAAGAEVELELSAQRGRGNASSTFYSYMPRTDEFIAQRRASLEGLPEHALAVKMLSGFDGLERYLAGGAPAARPERRAPGRERSLPPMERGRSRSGAGATLATRALAEMLAEVFAEQTDFEVRAERLAAAPARLERAEPARGPDTLTLLGTLHGLTICSEELKLTKGFSIARPEAVAWAPQAAASGLDGTLSDSEEHLLVILTAELSPAGAGEEQRCSPEERAIARGREVLGDLLGALRLFGDGRITLGPIAWARTGGEGQWSAVALGTGGRPHGMLVVSAEQEDELRAFCNLVSRRAPEGNALAWSRRRFELGCERESAFEGLTDHLLALRALLEPEGPASGLLAGRIAALCATPPNRAKLTKRMTRAIELEHAAVTGTASERAANLALARDVSDHLRALLRDVICGHLRPDLATLADELLSAPEASDEQPASKDADPAHEPDPDHELNPSAEHGGDAGAGVEGGREAHAGRTRITRVRSGSDPEQQVLVEA